MIKYDDLLINIKHQSAKSDYQPALKVRQNENENSRDEKQVEKVSYEKVLQLARSSKNYNDFLDALDKQNA